MFKKPQVRIFSCVIFLLIYILLFPTPRQVYEIKGLGLYKEAEVLLYTPQYTQNAVFTGSYYEVLTTLKNVRSTKETLKLYDFLTVVFFGNEEHVIRRLNIYNATVLEIEGGRLYTGYSAVVSGRTLSDGRVNVQVFCKEGKIYIGTPVIYGSY